LPRPNDRPRLLVLNQYYHPGVEATAHLLTELCEGLAERYEVTVVTGRVRDHENEPDYEHRNGVEILRVHSTAYDRAPLHRRAINYVTYLARALRQSLTAAPPDAVLCMTDPPLVGNVAYVIARRFRRPLVLISQDVFPEIAVRLKRLEQPLLVRLLALLVNHALRHADRVVAIGPVMRERLIAKGARAERTVVIPNWVDADAISPRPRPNGWSRENGLDGRFVVMHSGNVGHAQNLDVLIRATALLEDVEQLAVVIVGFGARHSATVELAEKVAPDRVSFLPYQPRERLPESLSSADVHYVGLPTGLAGFIVPSRVYGILAAGRPIVAAVDAESETAALVREVGCGIVVPPADPVAVAAALRAAAAGEHDLDAMGRRGREWVEANATRRAAVARYRELLVDVIG
jgi:glycosyltransferase involved in cell wall biosynthesis